MTNERAHQIADALGLRFGGQAEVHEVGNGRFRFGLVSPKFTGVRPLARQDEVWLELEKILTRDEMVDVSLVLTLAPEDMQAA